jgi:two-component system, cell cycle sensor histidine kinase and response regulator CckA
MPTDPHASRPGTGSPAPVLPRPDAGRERAAIDAATAGYLRPLLPTLSVLYLIFAGAHWFVLAPPARLVMVVAAVITAAVFAAFMFWMRTQPSDGPSVNPIGGVTGLMLWANSALHLALVREPKDTNNLIIVAVGISILLLDRRWFFTILGLCIATWLAVLSLSPPNPQWGHFGFAFVSFTVMAVLIHLGRIRDLRRIEGLRMVEEQREAQLEAALQDARTRLTSIWQNSRDGLLISNEAGVLVAVNQSVATLLGRSESELIGRHWLELLSESVDPVAASGAYARAFVNPESIPSEEREVPLASGRKVWLATSHLRLPQPTGGHLLLTLVRDVTERRKFDEDRLAIERRMQEAQRLESLGILAGGIAHDFNNLLTTIIGNIELAAMQLPATSTGRQNLHLAHAASERAAGLCQQMLAYAGQGRFTVEEVHLNALITDTCELLRVSLSKDVALELELDPALPALSADPSQLRQVIMNLVLNAAEAIGERPGTVRIHSRRAHPDEVRKSQPALTAGAAERFVALEFQDDGCGMTPDTQARIFEPFFTTKFTGRGLGLSAVLGIIRAHKGGILVVSRPGQGTVMRLFLPALDKPAPPQAPQKPAGLEWRGSGTVLVIDDEPLVRDVTRRQLERLGFHALVASSGGEGIDVARRHALRLILLDLTMPNMDGHQTLQALHTLPSPPPVVLMSGYSEHELHHRFATAGFAGFLQKPFTFEQLGNRMREALEPIEPGAPRSEG